MSHPYWLGLTVDDAPVYPASGTFFIPREVENMTERH
ncbi:hypothetical protein JOE11_003953 [Robbsia andropogonis]